MTIIQFSSFEIKLMRHLIKLANKAKGLTAPNPLVAAAVVKDGKILAEGFHAAYGQLHAEVVALQKMGNKAPGATLYITLEPCTHFGRNPPCTDLIIASGIKEVVYAIDDPNPLVRQNPAAKILQQAGIAVRSGLLAAEARRLNEVFFKNFSAKQPFVILKAGISLDGKIALSSGQSKYITGQASQKAVHKLRREVDAILVGINTLQKDDPSLTVRFNLLRKGYHNPKRVLLDSGLKVSLDAAIFKNASAKNIIFTAKESLVLPQYQILSTKAQIYGIEQKNSCLNWQQILEILYQREGVCSLLIEGGQQVFTSAIQGKIVDKVMFFMAPKFLLEKDAVSVFAGTPLKDLAQAITLKEISCQQIGDDFLVSGYL